MRLIDADYPMNIIEIAEEACCYQDVVDEPTVDALHNACTVIDGLLECPAIVHDYCPFDDADTECDNDSARCWYRYFTKGGDTDVV